MPEMGRQARKTHVSGRARSPSAGRRSGARTSLADALFTTTQQRVLGFLYGQPERTFFASELIELARSGSGAVQRELERLVDSGLVTSQTIGRQRHYQANPQSPIYKELRSIIVKTAGFAEVLRAALAPLESRIALALIYGSVAKGTATSGSDIDLLVVGEELTLEQLYSVLQVAEKRLRRTISPTLYTVDDFDRRLRKNSPFLSRVLSMAHIPLIGDPRALPAAR